MKNISLEQRRGLEHIDLNDYSVFCHASIDRVIQVFSQARRVINWEHNAYGRDIEILGQSFAVFQFRGHSWTGIRELNFLPFTLTFGDKDEVKLLSSLLRNKTIEYQVSDTGNNIGYKLYDSGELIERLYFSGDSEETTDEDIQ